MSVSYQDIPLHEDQGKFIQIPFREKTLNNSKASKYIYTHAETTDFIIEGLQRFCAEIQQMDQAFPDITSYVYNPDGNLPLSGEFKHNMTDKRKAPNSIMSYIGGIVSNYYRTGKTQDFSKSQIKHLENIWNNTIVPAFNNDWSSVNPKLFENGFNYKTNTANEPIKPIRFRRY